MKTKKTKVTKRERVKILELLREFFTVENTSKQVLHDLNKANKPVTVKN